MHIPDGFLSTPVWGIMDAVAAPTVVYLARRAQREFDHHKIPLMGVMGAFIFAAQMINFPVGNGTSGHLVGGALLSYTLGPAAAAIVMTAILATQALVFQDGGLLALGANVFNMAIAGVLAGYLPYMLARRWRPAIFLGGFLSLMTSALLALSELVLSGIPMPRPVLGISLAFFVVSALIEGAITYTVVQSLERIQPGFMRQPVRLRDKGPFALAASSVMFAAVAIFIASTHPDGIQKVAVQLGISQRAKALIATPLADYNMQLLSSLWLNRALAGLLGLGLVYVLCIVIARILLASRPAVRPAAGPEV